MVKCNFCYKELKPGTGKMFVKNDGKIFYFCSSKCERNLMKRKRKPFSFKWTKAPKTKEKTSVNSVKKEVKGTKKDETKNTSINKA